MLRSDATRPPQASGYPGVSPVLHIADFRLTRDTSSPHGGLTYPGLCRSPHRQIQGPIIVSALPPPPSRPIRCKLLCCIVLRDVRPMSALCPGGHIYRTLLSGGRIARRPQGRPGFAGAPPAVRGYAAAGPFNDPLREHGLARPRLRPRTNSGAALRRDRLERRRTPATCARPEWDGRQWKCTKHNANLSRGGQAFGV